MKNCGSRLKTSKLATCDFSNPASEVSKRELANLIAANASRPSQLKSTPSPHGRESSH